MGIEVNERQARSRVIERSGGACEICGRRATNIHHRKRRGMGGTRKQEINWPSNLLALCGSGMTGCHGKIESNITHAIEHGWIIPQGVAEAVNTPVLLRQGWVTLDNEGGWKSSGV